MDRAHFVYPVICWTLGLLPHFGWYKLCCRGHKCGSISLKSCFSILSDLYLEAELLGHMEVLVVTFLRKLHSVFFRGCTILHSYQQCTVWNFSTSLLMINICYGIFSSFSDRSEVISYCGFDFPWWLLILGIFHVPVHHLYVIFGELSTHVFWPFLNWVIWVSCCWIVLMYLGH